MAIPARSSEWPKWPERRAIVKTIALTTARRTRSSRARRRSQAICRPGASPATAPTAAPFETPKHVGTRQGIAEERLRGQPAKPMAAADGNRQEDPRQADAQNDPGAASQTPGWPPDAPAKDDREDLPRRQASTPPKHMAAATPPGSPLRQAAATVCRLDADSRGS